MKTNIAIIESDSVVASMMKANSALAGAVTVSQTKKIMDVARAAEIYAKRQHLSDEAIGQATSVKVEAMRKLGEILQDTKKNIGVRGSAVPNRNRANLDETPTLDELGLTKKESAVAQKLAALPEKDFEQIRLGNVTIAKAIAAVDSKPHQEPANAPQIAIPPLALVEEYTELDAARDQIEGLQDALAVANIGSTDPEEAAQAKNLIAELRAHIKTLEATLKAVKISRDGFQNQVAELQRQINRQRREIDKLAGTKTA